MGILPGISLVPTGVREKHENQVHSLESLPPFFALDPDCTELCHLSALLQCGQASVNPAFLLLTYLSRVYHMTFFYPFRPCFPAYSENTSLSPGLQNYV